MAMTPTPVFTQTPKEYIATLTTPTAITSRANITGTTGLVLLVPAGSVNPNGFRLDNITIKSKATSVAGTVCLWKYDGTTSYLWKEFLVTAITASTTVASFESSTDYLTGNLMLPTEGIYVSVTVQQDLTVYANGGAY